VSAPHSTDLLGGDPHRLVLVDIRASSGVVEHMSRLAGVVLPCRLARHPQALTNLVPGGTLTARRLYPLTAQGFELHISPGKLSQRFERIRGQRLDINHLHVCQDNLTSVIPLDQSCKSRSRTLLEVIVMDPDLVIGATGGRRARIVAARDLVPGARLARAGALETIDQRTTIRLQLWS